MKLLQLPQRFQQSNPRGLCSALDGEPVISLRLNPNKTFAHEQWNDTVEWCAQGRYLAERPYFTLDPFHAAGAYYVQEASSMVVGGIFSEIIAEMASQREQIVAVDLCAAPGGKSTHLSSILGAGGVLVANEVVRQRAGILVQNVVRWGDGNTVVTSSEAAELGEALSGSVDVLLCDVPCSGEGMFRKDNASRGEWSPQGVELCAHRARKIVAEAKRMLRHGAYLIFSTCTFNKMENEGTVNWLLENEDFELREEFTAKWGNSSKGRGSHFYPHEVRGEGFFVAVLQYMGESVEPKRGKAKGARQKFSSFSSQELLEIEIGGRLIGQSSLMREVVEQLHTGRVQMLYSGVEFGEILHGKLKPSHAFALYSGRSKELYPVTEVPLEVAHAFLRKDQLPAEIFATGLQVVSYGGVALGFAKGLGNRVNSLYPTSWRVVNSCSGN